MKTRTIVISAALFIIFAGGIKKAAAQAINTPTYRNAIGLRAGGTSGLTFKHFFSSGHAFEGIIGVWPNAFSITGLYERHVSSQTVSGFQWYYGAGAHFAHYARRVYYYTYNGRGPERYPYRYRYIDEGFAIGIDGILGMEYKIPPIPFAISFDLKPYFEIHQASGYAFIALDPGLGLKFTF